MNISALLTSVGINTAVCLVLLSVYSILRKQPSNVSVYFGRRLASVCPRPSDPFCFVRFVPSPSWIVKAWETTEEEMLAVGGMDAVVFLRAVVFRWLLTSQNFRQWSFCWWMSWKDSGSWFQLMVWLRLLWFCSSYFFLLWNFLCEINSCIFYEMLSLYWFIFPFLYWK